MRPGTRTLCSLALTVTALVAGCAPSGAADEAASVVPTAAPAVPLGSQAGVTEFLTRNSFTGIPLVWQTATWMTENEPEITVEIIEGEGRAETRAVIAWLDEHPPTACWAAYHATMRALLEDIDGAFAALAGILETGGSIAEGTVELETALALADEAKAMLDVPPESCP